MGQSHNHHFVPRHLLRRFSPDGKRISLLMRSNGAVIHNASIKGQCARHNFHPSPEFESALSPIENEDSRTITAVLEKVEKGNLDQLDVDTTVKVYRAMLFQRFRTARTVENGMDLETAFTKQIFRRWLEEYIASGNAPPNSETEVEERIVAQYVNPHAILLNAIGLSFESIELVVDLKLTALQNRTQHPFIIGDAPIVFYNSLLRRVKHRGVLGLQTIGLQVFWPISPTVLLMFWDTKHYYGQFANKSVFEVTEQIDVSRINALQLNQSITSVYFRDEPHAAYLNTLWRASRKELKHPHTNFKTYAKGEFVGPSNGRELYHSFDRQLPVDLTLSFIKHDIVPANEYNRIYYREPEIMADYKKRQRHLNESRFNLQDFDI